MAVRIYLNSVSSYTVACRDKQGTFEMDEQGIEYLKVTILPDNRVDSTNTGIALNKDPKTLANWRSQGIGPRAFKVGGRVFYNWPEVLAMARGEKPIRPEAA